MNHEPDRQLEALIHRELRQLPPLQAPGDLIARVRQAIASQGTLPWWSQSWFAWPRPAQFASALAAFALLGGVAWLLGGAWTEAALPGELSGTLAALGGAFGALLQFLATSAGVSVSMLLACALGALGVMYLSCIGLGTLFYKVAVNSR
jgi:hypothetical protein